MQILTNKKIKQLKRLHDKELREKFIEGYNRGLKKGYREAFLTNKILIDEDSLIQAISKHKIV